MIRLAAAAEADLRGIDAWIRDGAGHQAADRIMGQILSSIERLARFPYIGRPGRFGDTREWHVRSTSHVVVYSVAGDDVDVSRIIHTSMQWPPADVE